MSTPAAQPPTPRDVLRAYALQTTSTEQVWRALTEHTGWYVPAGFGVVALKNEVFENAVMFSEKFEADPSQLLLFTDREAALRAEGNRIGLFGSAFQCGRIFAALTSEFQ